MNVEWFAALSLIDFINGFRLFGYAQSGPVKLNHSFSSIPLIQLINFKETKRVGGLSSLGQESKESKEERVKAIKELLKRIVFRGRGLVPSHNQLFNQ